MRSAKDGLSLVMPMAGRGSRFSRAGQLQPKPLIDLDGMPFFWWATESVRRAAPVGEMVFVVLEEHCRDFAIDQRIAAFYPDAKLVRLPEVTAGAAETAMVGIEELAGTGPLAVNDCDHAFLCSGLPDAVAALSSNAAAGLVCFRSDSPAYSYARMDDEGFVADTVEKQVVSPFAIAGCYLFASPQTASGAMEAYRASCPYDELFISGLMNTILQSGDSITKTDLDLHLSFGTPEELEGVDIAVLRRHMAWRSLS
ncbi:NTP transferase domain-containing protein [Devosia sp. 1566]|uniref:NTP transferase domain-containing protein n=1 Tax=Devosia sp. 1566 TaxID=2499144 RepID=UPI000FDC2F1E|nr:NTP transferase domain-containing protein [Devosia sp. 1566]